MACIYTNHISVTFHNIRVKNSSKSINLTSYELAYQRTTYVYHMCIICISYANHMVHILHMICRIRHDAKKLSERMTSHCPFSVPDRLNAGLIQPQAESFRSANTSVILKCIQNRYLIKSVSLRSLRLSECYRVF